MKCACDWCRLERQRQQKSLEPETALGFYNIKVHGALDRFFKRMDAITTISTRPVGVPCRNTTRVPCEHITQGYEAHVKYI